MRRFYGYLATITTLVLGVGIATVPVLKDINANYEYASGREFTYRISFKETDDGIDRSQEKISVETSDWVAKTMDERLNLAGVSKYQVSQEGTDIIRVTLNRSSDIEYERARILLNYDPNFTVALGDKDKDALALKGEEVFGKARIEYMNTFPVVVIPLLNEEAITSFKALAEAGAENQTAAENAGTAQVPEGQSEAQLQPEATIVIWANYDPDYDSLDKAREDSEVAEKVFMTFDPRHVYWSKSDVENSEIALAMSLGEPDNLTGKYTAKNIETANNNAAYLRNIFNASTYGDYKISFLFENRVAPSVEYLLNSTETLAINWSKTLIATLVGLLLVLIVLVVFMRLDGVNAFVLALFNGVLTLATFNVIGLEFTTSGLVGLLVVVLLTILSVVLYHYRCKEEVYRGRTMAKASEEASGTTTFPIIDISVVTFLVGIGTYFFGGGALTGLATMLMIGSLANLLTGLLLNKFLVHFLKRTTALQEKYHLFGIDQSKVIQGETSQKETYRGRYAEVDMTKNHKRTGIGLGVFALASLVMTIVFGVTSGKILAPAVGGNYSRIYLSLKEGSPISTLSPTNSPELLLSKITIDGASLTYTSYDTEEVTLREGLGEEARDHDYTYYVFDLAKEYHGEELVSYTDLNGTVYEDVPLLEALTAVFEDVDEEAKVSLNPVQVTTGSPTFKEILLASLVSYALVIIYLLIRMGMNRAIAGLVLIFTGMIATLGLFVMSRINVLPLTGMVTLLTLLFSSYLLLLVGHKEKQLRSELLKRPDYAYEEEAVHAVGITTSPILLITLIAGLIFLNQFGLAPFNNAWLFMGAFLSSLIACLIIVKLFVPLELAIRRLLAKLPKIERKKKKVIKTNIGQRTSAEPEEAILIGIND
ncbi:MAG: hypothetical protein ACOX3K_04715 [Bacilli bacterium]